MTAIDHQPAYIQKSNAPDNRVPTPAGSVAQVTYFQFDVTFPPAEMDYSSVEASDSELLRIAEKAGTFDFLNAPEEDIYNADVAKG